MHLDPDPVSLPDSLPIYATGRSRSTIRVVRAIVEKQGDIFAADVDTIVVSVNCEGVMGAGIALEAKLRWPDLADHYSTQCDAGLLRPGKLILWTRTRPKILLFPTKDRWVRPSRLSFIDEGLAKLAATHRERGIRRIAIPHLGCSRGGLKWGQVRPLVIQHLGHLSDLEVEVYDFDPSAPDQWYAQLASDVAGRPVAEVSGLLNLGARQSRSLLMAIEDPVVQSMGRLQQVSGIGTKTLERVYDYLFGRTENHPQNRLDI